MSARARYEELARTMVGRTIRRVEYVELANDDRVPQWNLLSPRFDSLDFGLTLYFEDGSVMTIWWDFRFDPHHVALEAKPLVIDGAATWDATARWEPYLGTPIRDVKVFWDVSYEGNPTPQDVQVQLDRGAVTFSSFELRDDPLYLMDHITVFFDDEDLRRFGLGPFR